MTKSVTREQAAVFLYRFVTGYLGVEAGEGADLTIFADCDSIASSARDALSWPWPRGCSPDPPTMPRSPPVSRTVPSLPIC